MAPSIPFHTGRKSWSDMEWHKLYLITEHQTVRGVMDCCRRDDCCDPIDGEWNWSGNELANSKVSFLHFYSRTRKGALRCHSCRQHKEPRSIWQIVSLHSARGVLLRWVFVMFLFEWNFHLNFKIGNLLSIAFGFWIFDDGIGLPFAISFPSSTWEEDMSCKLRNFNDTPE